MSPPRVNRHFLRHYAEMVAAMLLGMVVLGVPAEAALRLAGSSSSELHTDAPSLLLLGMAVTMTVPMVAWMRHRGHGARPNTEMAASMMVPALATCALLWTGVTTDMGVLMTIEHSVMFPAMFGVMLLRRDEYAHDHRAHPASPKVIA